MSTRLEGERVVPLNQRHAGLDYNENGSLQTDAQATCVGRRGVSDCHSLAGNSLHCLHCWKRLSDERKLQVTLETVPAFLVEFGTRDQREEKLRAQEAKANEWKVEATRKRVGDFEKDRKAFYARQKERGCFKLDKQYVDDDTLRDAEEVQEFYDEESEDGVDPMCVRFDEWSCGLQLPDGDTDHNHHCASGEGGDSNVCDDLLSLQMLRDRIERVFVESNVHGPGEGGASFRAFFIHTDGQNHIGSGDTTRDIMASFDSISYHKTTYTTETDHYIFPDARQYEEDVNSKIDTEGDLEWKGKLVNAFKSASEVMWTVGAKGTGFLMYPTEPFLGLCYSGVRTDNGDVVGVMCEVVFT
eukprot:TRINITY_DN5525_c2_g2_i3.p1 TRINITY_DN5525_c2_g2~~TRINITY_DN5525_c2_g2_i3.p1  ORF type:complete len:357 (-),score=51.68 TRINITY_DN5525_c2_g2_i3:55-1125(-)